MIGWLFYRGINKAGSFGDLNYKAGSNQLQSGIICSDWFIIEQKGPSRALESDWLLGPKNLIGRWALDTNMIGPWAQGKSDWLLDTGA